MGGESEIDQGLFESRPTTPIIITNTAVKPNTNASVKLKQVQNKAATTVSAGWPENQHDGLPLSEKWFYPPDLKDDLLNTPLPPHFIDETLTTAWEYTRCVIPTFTNRTRYIAFVRLIAVTTVAEYHGSLVDIVNPNTNTNPNPKTGTETNTNANLKTTATIILGYDIDALLHTLFDDESTPPKIQSLMSREFRTNLLFAADKSCPARRNTTLFRRYVNLLSGSSGGRSPSSPKTWFRLRDSDGLARFTILASMVCNDVPYSRVSYDVDEEGWFSESQLAVLAEMSLTMYDAVAYYKHRAEGEVCNTFAYASGSGDGDGDDYSDRVIRKEAYHRCREVLWGLDAFYLSSSSLSSPSHASSAAKKMQCAINFVRYFGGPIHMMMRRYRFVDDELTIGRPETEEIVGDARRHVKLWNRVDVILQGASDGNNEDDSRYAVVAAQGDRLLIPGLLDLLQHEQEEGRCKDCEFRHVYGAEASGEFGGVRLCRACRLGWQEYLGSLATRAAEAFPVLQGAVLEDFSSQK